jgi:hypothetical protein
MWRIWRSFSPFFPFFFFFLALGDACWGKGACEADDVFDGPAVVTMGDNEVFFVMLPTFNRGSSSTIWKEPGAMSATEVND